MKLIFCGDFLYDDCEKHEDIETILEAFKADELIPIINFEGPLCKRSENRIKKRGKILCQADYCTEILKAHREIKLCLANNHMMDYGEQGLNETLNNLETIGIQHTGAGKNLKNAANPLLLQDEYDRISLLNFGWKYEETIYADENRPGCSKLETAFVYEQIKSVVASGNRVIVVFHWGFEFNLDPMPFYREFAYRCIEAGAELIVGHHPHVIQPYEEYKGKRIYYSLGNFYMGSLREGFNIDFGNGKEPYYSDLGACLIYDTEKKIFQTIGVRYNRRKMKSELIGNIELDDITNIDPRSDEYIIRTKRGIYGINPMLSMNENKNERILRKHLMVCQVYSSLKSLRRYPFIESIYKVLRKVYTR